MATPKVVFMGTPAFALPSLEACTEVGTVVAVVTQPDKPKGRGRSLALSPIKRFAVEHGIPVLQPTKLREGGFANGLRELAPDLCVVAAYGKILPKEILEIPRQGCLNVHASLLPRHRGAAPIQWAIAAGDPTTGVCLMKMDEGLDTGPVVGCLQVPIGPEDTAELVEQVLSKLGGELIRKLVPPYLRGELAPVPQAPEGAIRAPLLKKEDGQIDFRLPAVAIERRIRAFRPWPGSYTQLGGHTLKVHRARVGNSSGEPGRVLASGAAGIEVACGGGSLWLLEVQPEGKRAMTTQEFLAGHPVAIGDRAV
jgi:methionyl-tRNA formyltransferase